MKQRACITGITGQTGSYLAELLLGMGMEVHGMVRRTSVSNVTRIDHIYDKIALVYGDMGDSLSVSGWISKVKPDFLFNLAAQSHVRVSFDTPEHTVDVGGVGVFRCLEAIRQNSPATRFLQASTSELFGSTAPPQNENTLFHPRSPYGVAKLAGYWATVNYREAYGIHASNCISFNHESPRRGETFVTRKITRAATRIKLGLQQKLCLGNLESKRDWSHANDIARAMVMMLNSDTPDDYVVASGVSYSIREFLDAVFGRLGLNWKDHVIHDEKQVRPAEVDHLCGDATKIRTKLGWRPNYTFDMLVNEMVEYDLRLAQNEKSLGLTFR